MSTKKYTLNIFILYFLWIFLFYNTIDSIAQESTTNKGKLNFGFETGLQITGVSDPYMIVNKTGMGYSLGPFLDYYLGESIKVRVGINYDNRAFSLESSLLRLRVDTIQFMNSYYDLTEDYKVNYLTIPLSLIYIKGAGKFKLFLQGTIYYSILLNTVQTGLLDIYVDDVDATFLNAEDYPELSIPGHHYYQPENKNFNTSDIGINVNIGGIYYIKPKWGISLSAGLTHAFSNVWEDPLRNASWSTLYKVNAGIVYSIK